jgi:hypothetical protein
MDIEANGERGDAALPPRRAELTPDLAEKARRVLD